MSSCIEAKIHWSILLALCFTWAASGLNFWPKASYLKLSCAKGEEESLKSQWKWVEILAKS